MAPDLLMIAAGTGRNPYSLYLTPTRNTRPV